MIGKYAYSLDRELWIGRFDTRTQALAEALQKARTDDSFPASVYVGQRVAVDARTAGHAQSILNCISRRVRSELGESADNVLAGVTTEQVQELDGLIASAIVTWLHRHKLIQGFCRIEAISEHPVPPAPSASASPSSTEVQEIGTSEFTGEAQSGQ